MKGVWLEDLTGPEAQQRFAAGAVAVVLGVGSKAHGDHLPLKTGWLVARAVGQRLVERLPVVATIEPLPDPGATRVTRIDTADLVIDVEIATSLMLALDPRSVRMDRLPTGSQASAFKGERFLAARVDALAARLQSEWSELK
jgi:creatinine amidohydrolase/Fe(II)-dependent formamide hydrolase-like protein